NDLTDIEKNVLFFFSVNFRYHRLYFKQDNAFYQKSSLVRREFAKSGSITYLLGGGFTGKVIVRIIRNKAFQAWKRAFEAEETWKKLGFDYIPIEPILKKGNKLRAYQTRSGFWRVSTRVLGLSLASLSDVPVVRGYNHSQQNYNQLLATRDIIIRGLKQLGIIYAAETPSHLHDNNFCVELVDGRFRLYLIDFDQAVISES
ncbi:hypothetical protein HYX13_03460, partial [Candidatus Woesearchaeota archaeon]|nr:hypothetical protein [Candidatus Woesearchaeota archaeon]